MGTATARAASLWGVLLLGGCTTLPTVAPPEAQVPRTWSAPMPQEAAWPHEGRLDKLVQWWRQQGDPSLSALIEAAQEASPNVSSARARRQQAWAERQAAGSALVPQIDLNASAQRRSATPPFPAGEVVQGTVQLSWELDVFGGVRAQRQAAAWRLESADAAWHEARVSLAADVAQQVYAWRHCQAMLKQLQADAQAATRSAELMQVLAEAGLQPTEQADVARSVAAQARNQGRAQAQRCESDVKVLVQYTAWSEERVRAQLLQGTAPTGAESAGVPKALVPALPAATLAQRPDVFMAAAAVAAAAADVGAQHAQRFPRVGLNGSIGRLNSQSAAGSLTLDTWSVGPLSVSLPVFDAGRRAAALEAAKARYDDAVIQHQAVVRRAVREVEDALLALESSAQQAQDARDARDQNQRALRAVQQRAQQGLASDLDVQQALRRSVGAEINWLNLQRDRVAAWIGLYRAAGGGWVPTSKDAPLANTPAALTAQISPISLRANP